MFASSGWWGHALPYCESDAYACTYTVAQDAYYLAAGGTSYVAPQIAGLMALINQKTNARQGQADYTLYNLAAQEYGTPSSPNTANLASCSGSAQGASVGTSCIFRDIAADTPALQTGTNASLFITNGLIASNIVEPCKASGSGSITDCYRTVGTDTYGLTTIPGAASSTYGYFVGAGYDIVTGLGSVNIANLVNNWDDGHACLHQRDRASHQHVERHRLHQRHPDRHRYGPRPRRSRGPCRRGDLLHRFHLRHQPWHRDHQPQLHRHRRKHLLQRRCVSCGSRQLAQRRQQQPHRLLPRRRSQ